MAVSKRLSQQSAAKAVKPPKPEEVEEDMEEVELVEAEQISDYPPPSEPKMTEDEWHKETFGPQFDPNTGEPLTQKARDFRATFPKKVVATTSPATMDDATSKEVVATTSTPTPVKVNPDLFATLLAQGKIKTEGGQGRKLCPDCQYFIGARSGECPACGHVFPVAEPSTRTPRASYTPAKPIMGPQDYKRLSRAANRFRALFDSEDQALEVLEVAATLLDYCRHSLDEAASWIREDEEEDDAGE